MITSDGVSCALSGWTCIARVGAKSPPTSSAAISTGAGAACPARKVAEGFHGAKFRFDRRTPGW